MVEEKTLAQLREEALNPPADSPAPPDQPRDEQGRFAKAEAAPPAEEVVYEYEIDLGDGSGVQKFSAPTQEELIEKLGEAQRNATIKIREQAQLLKKQPAPPAAPAIKELTEDEKFLLSQKIMSDPGAAFQELADRYIMPKLEPRLAKAEKADRAIAQGEATQAFIQKHPEFYPSPANGSRIIKQLELNGADGTTVEQIEEAFKELSASGLLEARPAEAPGAGKPKEQAAGERIAPEQPGTKVTVRRVASGLSARRSAPTTSQEPTEIDIQKLSTEELRERAMRAVMQPA